MIRKKNKFSRPKKAYELSRIKEENGLLLKYGLKTKREIWKSIAKVNYFRKRAKALAKSSNEEQEVLFNKLRELGLKADNIADVLALKTENLLDRRLTTVVFRKGIAKTTQEARQMVAHKRIIIGDRITNSPSYLVPVSEESMIVLKKKADKPAKVEETKVEESK